MKTWIDILFRSIGILVICFIGVRIIGKRQLAKMTPFHFVSYMVIAILGGLLSANLITDLGKGLVSLMVWILIPLTMDYLSMKSRIFYDIFHGRETILVKDGKILENNLKHIRLTGDELIRELRNNDVFNIADVEFAIMEPSGEMNILFKTNKKIDSNNEWANTHRTN